MRPKPVLIVEDDPDSREMLSSCFEAAGIASRAAASAREGIALARETHPCLILLDLMLPDVNGAAFRRQQQRDVELAEIPVLVVSAHPDAWRIAKEMGAVGLVRKPIDLDKLLAAVSQFCEPPAA